MYKIAVLFSLVATLAFAGKAEREFIKEKLQPAVAAAEAAYKKSCGCSLKITYSADLKSEDHLSLVRNMADSIESGVKYCTDAASKQAVCKMKTVELKLGKETGFSFAGSHGAAVTDGTAYPTFDMMTDKIDN
jgi:hypothetical protein